MRLAFSLIFAVFLAVTESRVTFDTSEVLDNVDLKGAKATATFRCYAGCRVYSPTPNADIAILDNAGKQWSTLLDLSKLESGKVVELPVSTALYKLVNKGADDPSFVFYAVEKGATNYETQVAYVNAVTKHKVNPKTKSLLTVLSGSGAVRISNFQGDFTGALPTVHAVPADAITTLSTCLPVYDALTASTVHNTDFTVLGPIATINLKTTGGDKSVQIGGDWSLTAQGKDTTAVYVSPGYVGCDKLGDALYTFLPPVTSFSRQWSLTDSNGISLTVDGNWSIEKEENALQLTVNGDVKNLFGKSQLAKIYDDTSFKIAIKWDKKDGSKDRFSMQIDALSHSNVQTTTKSVNSITIGSTIIMMVVSMLIRL